MATLKDDDLKSWSRELRLKKIFAHFRENLSTLILHPSRRTEFRQVLGLALVVAVLQLSACQNEPVANGIQVDEKPPTQDSSTATSDSSNTKSDAEDPDKDSVNTSTETVLNLFDGKSLDGWEITNFGGEGDCRNEDGIVTVEAGYPMSGITSTREDLPTNHYEISLEARKTEGIDFFCGLTFPVDETHCTFVVGGWAGAVVGLSCIDGQDASTNETRKLMNFEKDRWYRIKVSVAPERIQAWIDDEKVVDFETTDHKLSLRNETLPSRPLGLCNFETTSEFKNLKIRLLDSSSKN